MARVLGFEKARKARDTARRDESMAALPGPPEELVEPSIVPHPHHRVQLRVAMDDIDQIERDLTVIRLACDNALGELRLAKRRRPVRGRDHAVIVRTIRGIIEQANLVISAKHHGR